MGLEQELSILVNYKKQGAVFLDTNPNLINLKSSYVYIISTKKSGSVRAFNKEDDALKYINDHKKTKYKLKKLKLY